MSSMNATAAYSYCINSVLVPDAHLTLCFTELSHQQNMQVDLFVRFLCRLCTLGLLSTPLQSRTCRREDYNIIMHGRLLVIHLCTTPRVHKPHVLLTTPCSYWHRHGTPKGTTHLLYSIPVAHSQLIYLASTG